MLPALVVLDERLELLFGSPFARRSDEARIKTTSRLRAIACFFFLETWVTSWSPPLVETGIYPVPRRKHPKLSGARLRG
jgi:hypothetical protein